MYVTAISQANTTSYNLTSSSSLSREITFDSLTVNRTFSFSKLRPSIDSLILSWKQLNQRQSMFSIRIESENGLHHSKKMKITRKMDLDQIFLRVSSQITKMSDDISSIKIVYLEIESRKRAKMQKTELTSEKPALSIFANLDIIRSKFGIDNLIGKTTLHELAQNPLSLAS